MDENIETMRKPSIPHVHRFFSCRSHLGFQRKDALIIQDSVTDGTHFSISVNPWTKVHRTFKNSLLYNKTNKMSALSFPLPLPTISEMSMHCNVRAYRDELINMGTSKWIVMNHKKERVNHKSNMETRHKWKVTRLYEDGPKMTGMKRKT